MTPLDAVSTVAKWTGLLLGGLLLLAVSGGPLLACEGCGAGDGPVYTPIASPRGDQPHHPFMAGEIDRVDTATGNVVVSIPLGQTYHVGPVLSYQLKVVHNTYAWNTIDWGCFLNPECPTEDQHVDFSLPNPSSNAGLGWELHFGKLFPPERPAGLDPVEWMLWPNSPEFADSPDGARWLYVAPDGAALRLADNGLSKDGSFVRLKKISNTERHVQFPDGTYSVFKRVNTALGTNFCGNGISGCWRFEEKRDGYGNYFKVSYSNPKGDPEREQWRVSDSTVRQTHLIDFSLKDSARGGGDGPIYTDHYYRIDGSDDEFGDLRRVLTSVRVAAFGNTRALYSFKYTVKKIARGCPHEIDRLHGRYATITIPILEEVQAPHLQPWRINTWAEDADSCQTYNGRLKEVTLPTRGKLAWDYQNWAFPTRCEYRTENDDGVEFRYYKLGVKTRRTRDNADSEIGAWKYKSVLLSTEYPNGLPSSVLAGQDCARADYRVTTIDEPAGENGKNTRRVHYHAVHQGGFRPKPDARIDKWQVTDNGLPFTKEPALAIGDSSAEKRFLSQRVFLCSAPGNCGNPKMSVYLRYATEFRGTCSKVVNDSASCWQANPIRAAERTVYHDDDDRFVEWKNTWYDGAGHFEGSETVHSFSSEEGLFRETNYTATDSEAGTTRLEIDEETGYIDAGEPSGYLPGLAEPWVLHPYDRISATKLDRTYVTEFSFDPAGSLSCSRRWKEFEAGRDRSPQDLVVELSRGTVVGKDLGMPITEVVAGGENGELSELDPFCDTSGSSADGSRYQLDHVYDRLTLASTRIGSFPYWYRATIDRNTGLPKETFNPAGQKTTHRYDSLSRLTGLFPGASLGEAATVIAYANPADTSPSVFTTRKFGDDELYQVKEYYTQHGQVFSKHVQRARGTNLAWSKTRTSYDKAGRVKKITTTQNRDDDFDLGKATVFENFDIFDRPERVVRPDFTVERRGYEGQRRSWSEVDVRTSEDSATAVQTVTLKDAYGNVVRVENPKHTTNYVYDPFNQRIESKRSVSGTVQRRQFGYDARGLLLSESHPELGASGGGTVTFDPDAFGQPRRVRIGSRDLTYQYDNASRMTAVLETGSGRLWKEWEYGVTNDLPNDDYRMGKVTKARRHNHVPFQGALVDWLVEETYQYAGALGKLSGKTTQLLWPGNEDDAAIGNFFTQSFDYDPLGNETVVGYPVCAPAPQNGSERCRDSSHDRPGPSHNVTTTISHGFPTSVASDLSAGPWAAYFYHPNLQVSGLNYSNGVTGYFDQGTRGMKRPARLQYTKNERQVVLFDTGAYSFDGAGNVWRIGADLYLYDKASRLLDATFSPVAVPPPAERREQYRYDAGDNVTQRRVDNGTWDLFRVDRSNNRFLGPAGRPQDIFYDDFGNIRSVGLFPPPPAGSGGPVWEMRYDPFGMQEWFRDNRSVMGQEYAYLYGPGDRRLMMHDYRTGTRVWRFRDRKGKVLREFELRGWGDYDPASGDPGEIWGWIKDSIHGPTGLVATRTYNGTTSYFHQDHLGSPRIITDSVASIRGRHDYYPFGTEVVRFGMPADEATSKFTGHERDPHGLSDYMLGRTYMFPLYRFASPDPARDGWNLYAYVGNNPLGFVDPDGRQAKTVDGKEGPEEPPLYEKAVEAAAPHAREAEAALKDVVTLVGGAAVVAQIATTQVVADVTAVAASSKTMVATMEAAGSAKGLAAAEAGLAKATANVAAANRAAASARVIGGAASGYGAVAIAIGFVLNEGIKAYTRKTEAATRDLVTNGAPGEDNARVLMRMRQAQARARGNP